MTIMTPDHQSPTTNRDGEDRGREVRFERAPFLATSRALSACARELTRLTDTLVRGVGALELSNTGDKPVVRQSPTRCIVQLGPVALTVTWLRPGAGAVEDGELLVILWRGAVAPRGEHCPERAPMQRAPRSATALWEQTLRPVAADEASWVWELAGEASRHSSSEISELCVTRLRVAYEECADAERAAAARLEGASAMSVANDPPLPTQRKARVA